MFEVGIISLIFVALNNIVSYHYNGDFFVFSKLDAKFYHKVAMELNRSTGSIRHTLDRMGFDYIKFEDYGQIVSVSLIYKIWSSNLMLNLYYIVLSIYGSKYLYLLALNFMHRKYAYFASIIFYTSSFIIFYNSTGLKEPQMIFLIILAFYHFYRFLIFGRKRSILLSLFCVLLLLFFRPAISFFIVLSCLIGYMYIKKTSKKLIVLTISIFVFFSLNFSIVEQQQKRYLRDNYSELVESNEAAGMIRGGLAFTYFVNTLSSLIGHFPTINLEKIQPVKNICSSGLSTKVILSIFYLMGLYLIFKHKVYELLPLALFILMESASLIFIFEALELRKSIPHYPFIYLIIFWVINHFEKPISSKLKLKMNPVYLYFYIFSNLLLVIYWNVR